MGKKQIALTFFLSFVLSNLINAQVGTAAQRNSTTAAVFTNLNSAITKNTVNNVVLYKSDMTGLANDIPLSRITGSRFWKNMWLYASLYDIHNKLIAFIPAKLNLNYSSVHYIDANGAELALDPEVVRKVIFHTDTVTYKTVGVFVNFMPYVYLNNQKINDYLQVMNEGKAALLKYQRSIIASADSAFGTAKRYFFKTEEFYYLWFNNKVEPIKKMNKEVFFQLIPGALVYEDWVIKNKINLKREEDVLKFLEYYNAQKQ